MRQILFHQFQIEVIGPGDYTAFSQEALEENASFDPNLMRPFEPKSKFSPIEVIDILQVMGLQS